MIKERKKKVVKTPEDKIKVSPETKETAPDQNLKLKEEQRQIAEFKWENNIKTIDKTLNQLDLSAYTVSNLSKQLDKLFQDNGIVDKKHIVDKDTKIQLINGVDTSDLTLGELMSFLKERTDKEQYYDKGLQFQTLVIKKYNDNPFLHPLAKSLNIDKMSDEWLETHAFITPEVYDLINKGFLFGDKDNFGFWNTDFEKAHKDLSKYKKVRKLVYRDGKAYITTVYESNFVPVKGEEDIKLEDHEMIKEHGLSELKEGDTVDFVDKDGETKQAKVIKIKHHAVTDKFGTADLLLDDGTKLSKSLKLIRKNFSGKNKKPVEETIVLKEEDFKPLKLSDLSDPTSIGGSSDVKSMMDKNGKKWVVKKARSKDGSYINGQLEQEQLTDNLYKIVGFETPDSYLIKEDGIVYKIAPFLERMKDLGSLDSDTKDFAYKEVQKGFVMDALLGNWDVIGAGEDNILFHRVSGEVVRVDNGGALEYRAKGRKKAEGDFDAEIKELKTFLEPINPVTSRIYKGITPEEVKSQAKAIIDKRKEIEGLVFAFEAHNPSHKGIATKLYKRLNWLDKNIANATISPEELKKAEKLKAEEYDKDKYDSRVTQNYFKDWDDFEIEGNTGMKDAIKNQILKIEKSHQSYYERFAKDHGLTVAEYKQELQNHVEKLIEESEFFRATDIDILDKILVDHGRYKSQFETKKSHGSYDPYSRSRTENKYFGFADDVNHDVENRPIYGYCSRNENGVNNDEGEIPPPTEASNYGKVTVKIKREEALKKATLTFGDSLGGITEFASTPAAKPHFTSFGTRDGLKMKNTCELPFYTEIQYHNKLTFKNIESIHMSPNAYSVKSKAFDEINWMIEIGRKTDVPIILFNNK